MVAGNLRWRGSHDGGDRMVAGGLIVAGFAWIWWLRGSRGSDGCEDLKVAGI